MAAKKKKTSSSTQKTAASKKKAATASSKPSSSSSSATSKKKASSAKKKTAATSSKKAAAPAKSSKATASKKAPVKKKAPAKRSSKKTAEPEIDEVVLPKGKAMGQRDLKKFRKLLLELRERLVGDIQFLTTDNLHRAGRETGADLSGASQHSADHGTDNFDREFALSLATSEQDVLFEVDDALIRIEEGTYGFCEMTGLPIEKARLEVIPYTRFSVQAQAQMEKGRTRYRPFSQNISQW